MKIPQETDERYELTDLRTGEIQEIDIAAAAVIMKLDPDETAWCREAYGVSDTDRYQLTEI